VGAGRKKAGAKTRGNHPIKGYSRKRTNRGPDSKLRGRKKLYKNSSSGGKREKKMARVIHIL